MPLVLNFGVPLEIGVPGEPATAERDSFFAPVSALPATTSFTGTSAGMQIDFSPLGAHMFMGLPLDELPQPVAYLGSLLGVEGRRLTEALEDASTWERRVDLLDAAIVRRLALARPPKPSVEWAWRVLEESNGRIDIGRLSERLGCSRRHLIAGFREQVGVPPKTAARILRLQRAATLLRERRKTLARVAAEAGYHDQAHMTREFRRLAMTTPADFAAAWQPGFLGVPEDRVKSVQDSGR